MYSPSWAKSAIDVGQLVEPLLGETDGEAAELDVLPAGQDRR